MNSHVAMPSASAQKRSTTPARSRRARATRWLSSCGQTLQTWSIATIEDGARSRRAQVGRVSGEQLDGAHKHTACGPSKNAVAACQQTRNWRLQRNRRLASCRPSLRVGVRPSRLHHTWSVRLRFCFMYKTRVGFFLNLTSSNSRTPAGHLSLGHRSLGPPASP